MYSPFCWSCSIQARAWRDLAGQLAVLLTYISLNMRALRKIVKKLNKHVGSLPVQQELGVTTALHFMHPQVGRQRGSEVN